jgi:photosystem II stability/assembly factor-like uncharacterized protein
MIDDRDLERRLQSHLNAERQAYPSPPYLETRLRQAMRRPFPARERRGWMPQLAAAAALILFVGLLTGGVAWLKASGLGPFGTSAKVATQPVTGDVEALHFASSGAGWIVTATANADGTLARRLYRTDDTGQHWTSQLTWNAQPRAAAPGSAVRLVFADQAHGFVLDPAASDGQPLLFRTRDGGASWQRLPLPGIPGPGSAISFIDAQHGWLLADVNAAMSQSSASIFRTSDGGSSWTRIAHVDYGGRSQGLTADGDKDNLAFSSASDGWLTASSAAGNAIIWVTGDGGVTWKQQSLPAPPGVYVSGNAMPGAPRFFGPRQGVLPVEINLMPLPTNSSQSVPAQGYPRVLYAYVSNDGGQSWTTVRLPATGNAEQPLSWQFLDPQNWWIASGAQLFVTADGGRSWSQRLLALGGQSLLALGFVSKQAGWAVAGTWAPESGRATGSTLLRTSDGGAHWVQGTASVHHQNS